MWAQRYDVPVDPLVEVDQLALVRAPFVRGELRERNASVSTPVGVVPPLGREPRRLALEHEPHLGKTRDVPDVDPGDEDPATREHLDELLPGEVAERLAHRCPPHPEPFHQLALAHDRPGRELERDDQLADRVVRPVGERLLVGDDGAG